MKWPKSEQKHKFGGWGLWSDNISNKDSKPKPRKKATPLKMPLEVLKPYCRHCTA